MKKIITVVLAVAAICTNVPASSVVEYDIPATYEIEIPATIRVGDEMSMNGYFNIPDGSGVNVYIADWSFGDSGAINLTNSSGDVVAASFYNDMNERVTGSAVPLVRFTSDSSESTTFYSDISDYGNGRAGKYTGTVEFHFELVETM